MYLPDLDEARNEALRTFHDLLMVAERSGESPADCEIQIADATGEPVLTIPLEHTRH
jgi:acetyl/propionyl-CoA carboxylase alpha subunit